MPPFGSDPRRRLSREEALELYTRADGRCQNCGVELGVTWHGAHLVAWSNGGATSLDNMQAWCAPCNLQLGARNVESVEDVKLRPWQQQALGPILTRLWETGSATLHAAPGAGKTLFLAAVFRHLQQRGYADRLVVVVPNRNLQEQTKRAFARMKIHLDDSPRDGVWEHPQTHGLVICYQSLSPRAADAHALEMQRALTMVAFDEVHHLAEKGNSAWARAAMTMVGDIAEEAPGNAAAVLNMTGTLFRSSQSQRIGTVRYQRVEGNRWQAQADWSVPTAALVGVELRAPDLYVFGGQAKLVDLENEKIIESDIADLTKRERSATLREAYRDRDWLRTYCAEAMRMLKNQLLAVENQVPLKLLFVADRQHEARLAADLINEIAGQEFARLIISDEPGALRELRRAARESEPCAIVAVQMVTEGFDCPELATIAHATKKAAPLFVAQLMARAMRLTDHERAIPRFLPAQILVPDDPVLREAYASALVSALHMVEDEAEDQRCHDGHRRTRCACQYPDDICSCPPWGSGGAPQFELLELDDPTLRGATVLGHEDGEVDAPELFHWIEQCNNLLIPETYAPRVAVASRRRPILRRYVKPEASESPAGPRDIVQAHRAILRQAAGWMEKHIGHDSRYSNVGVFQGQANDAGGISTGGRDHATPEQLSMAADWMRARVREHCSNNNEPTPAFAKGGGRA
jgi:superfamily II DNA or RNA helicase